MNQAIYAIFAAILFGAATPFAKVLVGEVQPIFLAGLLYLSSGLSLALIYMFRDRSRDSEPPLARSDAPWLAGAVLSGGIVAPVLLMVGLSRIEASAASLLLNLEGVFTALLAWLVFREHFSLRTIAGMALIITGGVILSWPQAGFELPIGSVAVAGACLAWGIDNNFTQKVSAGNPVFIAAAKGIVAGGVNLSIGAYLGATVPSVSILAGAIAVGCLGYGISLVLFVLSLRHIGTARTGAYFSIAPFVGAAIAIVFLHEPVGINFVAVAILMGIGIWFYLTEKHLHDHSHERIAHSHTHRHGFHHLHEHDSGTDSDSSPHKHWHVHEPLTHDHQHFPDIHHRHKH